MSAAMILCCPREPPSHPTHLSSVVNAVAAQGRLQNHCSSRDRFFAFIEAGVGRRWFFHAKIRCASSSIVVLRRVRAAGTLRGNQSSFIPFGGSVINGVVIALLDRGRRDLRRAKMPPSIAPSPLVDWRNFR
jgi:hypothetical protein